MCFNSQHLQVFKQEASRGEWLYGRKVRSWAISIEVDKNICADLPDKKIDRACLKNICADLQSFSSEYCFLSIIAWGGMNVAHGRLAWQSRHDICKIISDIRNGNLSRYQAYQKFKEFRLNKPGCGMGPAYYTKLIFFADPLHNGYIMDQWTSLSINLLMCDGQTPMIDMITGTNRDRRFDWVSDSNTADTYENFCSAVEQLGKEIGQCPEETEMRLFSVGGRNPGEWRTYVKSHRPPLPSQHSTVLA